MISQLVLPSDLPKDLEGLVIEYYASLILYENPIDIPPGLISKKKRAELCHQILEDFLPRNRSLEPNFVPLTILRFSPLSTYEGKKNELDRIILFLYSCYNLSSRDLLLIEDFFKDIELYTFGLLVNSSGYHGTDLILFPRHLEIFLDHLQSLGVRIDRFIHLYMVPSLRYSVLNYLPLRFYLYFLKQLLASDAEHPHPAWGSIEPLITIYSLHYSFIDHLRSEIDIITISEGEYITKQLKKYREVMHLLRKLYQKFSLPEEIDPFLSRGFIGPGSRFHKENLETLRIRISQLPKEWQEEHYACLPGIRAHINDISLTSILD